MFSDKLCKACFTSSLVLALGAVAAFAVYNYIFPRPRVIASSDSPDGSLRAVVVEHPPEWGKASPHRYFFSLESVRGTGPLNGTLYVYVTDSTDLSEVRFQWSQNKVTVTSEYDGQFVGELEGDQRWSRVRN